jgi:hypothetical protein
VFGGKTKQAMDTLGTAPAAPAFSFILAGSAILLVGPDQQSLVVHESYLTLKSEFFKAAMKMEWAAGQTHFVKLPKDDVETTTNYLTFTYGRGLPTQTIESIPRECITWWDLLVKLYIFGDRRLDKCVRNAVIQELVCLSILRDKSGINNFMPTSGSRKWFGVIPGGSPIRRLIVCLHRRSASKAG